MHTPKVAMSLDRKVWMECGVWAADVQTDLINKKKRSWLEKDLNTEGRMKMHTENACETQICPDTKKMVSDKNFLFQEFEWKNRAQDEEEEEKLWVSSARQKRTKEKNVQTGLN